MDRDQQKPSPTKKIRRYRSMRAMHVWQRFGLLLIRLECLTLTISEIWGQMIRHMIAFPGRVLMLGFNRSGRLPNKKWLALGTLGLSLAFLSLFVSTSFPNAYAVALDGQTVAVVADYADMEEAVQDYLSQHSEHYSNIHYTDNIEYLPVRAKTEELSDDKAIASLCEELNFVAVGYKMFINGEEVATLQTKEEGEQVIQEIVAGYQPEVSSGTLEITDVKVSEKIEYVQMEVGIHDFTDFETFKGYLMHGEEVQKTYTVKKNDTLSQIAERFSLTTDELREANPKHQPSNSYLQIGEVLNLNVVEKPVHIVATGKLVKEESIPFTTAYTNDATLWRGQYKTITSGEYGSKEVEYEIIFENGQEMERLEVAEVVISDPTTKVVASGTKYVMASRGDGGSGAVAWPMRGRITSPYGWRSSGFHYGLDIGGKTGDPIYAAESGVVTFAAWSGSYGRLVKIDHGDGLETRYAHLSGYKVSYAEQVSRGDLIGLVGSSGNSTGPHLHFEVRVNGVAKNPINYLE